VIYDFTSRPVKIKDGVVPERAPAISPEPYAADPVEREAKKLYELVNRQPNDVRSILPKGFEALDEGIKLWLSDIVVPSGDGTKRLTVRIAGGDKTFLFWAQNLNTGRIKLPVCSVNRTGWKFNEQKFSPPVVPMSKCFTDRNGTHARLSYRPWPALVDYQLSIWTEWKPDMEYIQYQIVTRMNPLAEIIIEDDNLRGAVQIKFNGATDNTEIDIAADDLSKIRYDIDIQCEAWLPLPDKIVPTVLGHVGTLHEFDGTFLSTAGLKNSNVIIDGFSLGPNSIGGI